MSDLSDSRVSGLADWALVNSQGELESSDADSNTSSIEVVGRDTEGEEEEGLQDPVSHDSSQECIELEHLMKTADASARPMESGEKGEATEEAGERAKSHTHGGCEERAVVSQPVTTPKELGRSSMSYGWQSDLETVGACSPEFPQQHKAGNKRDRPTQGKEKSLMGGDSEVARPVDPLSQLPQGSDCPTTYAATTSAVVSSDSALSVSTTSSASSVSKYGRTDSDSESDFVRLEKDSSSVSTESEGEECQSLAQASAMVTSESSVGSGFNFLCNTKVQQQQQPPQPQPQRKTPLYQVTLPDQFLLLTHPQGDGQEASSTTTPTQQDSTSLSQEGEHEEMEISASTSQELVATCMHENKSIRSAGKKAVDGEGKRGMISSPEQERRDAQGREEEEIVPEQADEMMARQEVVEEEEAEGLAEEVEEEEDEDEEPEELQGDPGEGDGQEVLGPEPDEAEEDGGLVPLDDADEDDVSNHDVDDTESSTEEGDQDDRIESEQSDDAHSAPPDDLDQVDLSVVNDIGDLPVGRGSVERHYIHYNNQQLNGKLNRVVITVLIMALGMGLGHWIGSTREHFSQLEIQLSQMRRLHQMQDEFMQCLTRNDELLVDFDIALQETDDFAKESDDFAQESDDFAEESESHAQDSDDENSDKDELSDSGIEVSDEYESNSKRVAEEGHASSARADCGLPGSQPRPIPVDITLLQRNLTQERQRAEMWRHLYLWERQERQGSREVQDGESRLNASACLHYLMRSANMSGLGQLWNMSTGGRGTGINNLTSLVSSIAKLHQHLLEALPTMWRDLSDLSLHHQQQSVSLLQQAGREGHESMAADTNVEEPPSISGWSDGVKTLLNKTRGTLSNVSRHLQHTWNQVKVVSSHLWAHSNNTVLGRMAARVKDSVSKLSHDVHGKALYWLRKRSSSSSKFGHKHGSKKGSPEAALSEEENTGGEEEREQQKRYEERSGGETMQEGGEYHKDSHAGNNDGKRLASLHQSSFDENDNQVSDQKQYGPQYEKEVHLGSDHGKNHRNEKRKDKRYGKHQKDDSDSTSSKKKAPEKNYRNDSKYSRRYNSHRDEQEDPHCHKDKKENEHHRKDWYNRKNNDKKHHHEGSHSKKSHRSEIKGDNNKENKDKHSRSRNFSAKSDREKENKDNDRNTHSSTTAKPQRYKADREMNRARYRAQKQFHKLFSKTGAMSRQVYQAMDGEDVDKMVDELKKMSGVYSDLNLGLPQSGFQWLQCQSRFWKEAKQHRQPRYDTEEQCLRLLAAWQTSLVSDFRDRLTRGECKKVRISSYVLDSFTEEEDYYHYICSEDGDHKLHYHEDCDKSQKNQPHVPTPKGQREGEQGKAKPDAQIKPWRNDKTTEEGTSKQVNLSDQGFQAWYFQWVEGRNNLRSLEHQADWLFERASGRGQIREDKHKADWVFERAAERNSHRHYGDDDDDDGQNDDEDDDDDDDGERGFDEERKVKHSRWQGERMRAKRSHPQEAHGSHFHHDRKHHWHKDSEHRSKHHQKDYRQKYGQTDF